MDFDTAAYSIHGSHPQAEQHCPHGASRGQAAAAARFGSAGVSVAT